MPKRPVRFSLTGGQRGGHTSADRYRDWGRHRRQGVLIRDPEAVIQSNRRDPDRELYRERNLIERAFNKLKQWRRIATRYDRKSLYFPALHLVASVIWG